MSEGRYQAIVEPHVGFVYCEDCGSVVPEGLRPIHDRHHAIQNDGARAIAMLMVTHIAPHVHDRYDVKDRFDAKRNTDNWSAEAFAEVTSELDAEPPGFPIGLGGRRVPAEPGVDMSAPDDHGIVRRLP